MHFLSISERPHSTYKRAVVCTAATRERALRIWMPITGSLANWADSIRMLIAKSSVGPAINSRVDA